jgi:hypothetical protein
MTVSEYVTRFMQLFRYALNDVDTDEKKQECFLNLLDKQAQAGVPKSTEHQLQALHQCQFFAC